MVVHGLLWIWVTQGAQCRGLLVCLWLLQDSLDSALPPVVSLLSFVSLWVPTRVCHTKLCPHLSFLGGGHVCVGSWVGLSLLGFRGECCSGMSEGVLQTPPSI